MSEYPQWPQWLTELLSSKAELESIQLQHAREAMLYAMKQQAKQREQERAAITEHAQQLTSPEPVTKDELVTASMPWSNPASDPLKDLLAMKKKYENYVHRTSNLEWGKLFPNVPVGKVNIKWSIRESE